MKRNPAHARLLILGEGLVANTLATVLNGILVNRQSDDAGWNWPRNPPKPPKGAPKFFSLVLVAPTGASASQIVRWHGEAWRRPWIEDARLVIVCLGESLSRELPTRDVFGRSVNTEGSFASWKKSIAISKISDGLAGILSELAALSALPLDTWKQREEMTSILPPLMRVLDTEDAEELEGLLSRLHQQDWDAFCPHATANRIRCWLASVTDGVAPSWKEGKTLFRSLAHSQK